MSKRFTFCGAFLIFQSIEEHNSMLDGCKVFFCLYALFFTANQGAAFMPASGVFAGIISNSAGTEPCPTKTIDPAKTIV
jgi:hypothetical protein